MFFQRQLTIVNKFHKTVIAEAGVEVGHERRDELSGCQPLVYVISDVQEAAGGDRHVGHVVTVKRKREGQAYRLQKKTIWNEHCGCRKITLRELSIGQYCIAILLTCMSSIGRQFIIYRLSEVNNS